MTFRLPLLALAAVALAACGTDDAVETPVAAGDDAVTAFVDAPDLAAGTYTIDPSHSRAEFGVRHLGISTVEGTFTGVDGTVTVGDGLGSIEATAVIDASTINTGNSDRDGHLRSPDFFDVAQYPEITFQSTDIRPTADGFVLVGDLTMHGVTRPVELTGEYLGSATAPNGTEKLALAASGEINRQDWGLTWSQTNEAGELVVSDDVTLDLEVQANRQPDEAAPEA